MITYTGGDPIVVYTGARSDITPPTLTTQHNNGLNNEVTYKYIRSFVVKTHLPETIHTNNASADVPFWYL